MDAVREHVIGGPPINDQVTVDKLVAAVANLYKGNIFNRATGTVRFGLNSVVPLQLRKTVKKEEKKQDPPETDKTQNQIESFEVHEIFEKCVNG
jgi:hypothetical protein